VKNHMEADRVEGCPVGPDQGAAIVGTTSGERCVRM
jgi:hypothetical protein